MVMRTANRGALHKLDYCACTVQRCSQCRASSTQHQRRKAPSFIKFQHICTVIPAIGWLEPVTAIRLGGTSTSPWRVLRLSEAHHKLTINLRGDCAGGLWPLP